MTFWRSSFQLSTVVGGPVSPGFVALLGGNTPRLQHLSLAHAALKDGLGSALVRRLRGAKQREHGLTGWTVSCFFSWIFLVSLHVWNRAWSRHLMHINMFGTQRYISQDQFQGDHFSVPTASQDLNKNIV